MVSSESMSSFSFINCIKDITTINQLEKHLGHFVISRSYLFYFIVSMVKKNRFPLVQYLVNHFNLNQDSSGPWNDCKRSILVELSDSTKWDKRSVNNELSITRHEECLMGIRFSREDFNFYSPKNLVVENVFLRRVVYKKHPRIMAKILILDPRNFLRYFESMNILSREILLENDMLLLREVIQSLLESEQKNFNILIKLLKYFRVNVNELSTSTVLYLIFTLGQTNDSKLIKLTRLIDYSRHMKYPAFVEHLYRYKNMMLYHRYVNDILLKAPFYYRIKYFFEDLFSTRRVALVHLEED